MNYMKLFQLSFVAALLAACSPKLSENQYSLEGTIDGRDGQEIYLVYGDANDGMTIDTAVVTKGKFEFGGMLEKPIRMATLCMGNLQNWENPDRLTLYIEPKRMTVAIDAEGFQAARVTGSHTQAEADTLQQQQGKLLEQLMAINKQITAAKGDERAALEAQAFPLRNRCKEIEMEFIKTHPDSFLAPIKLIYHTGDMTYEEIKAVYDRFSDRVKRYGDVKAIEEELAALERVQPGKPAPEIRKEDVNGNVIALSDLKGKYVLLDFWASWCAPCRKSFPHVKALYEKYHAKGFEVFCVADNDSNEDAWRKAIEDDGVGMFSHVLRGLRSYRDENGKHHFDKTNDVSERYAIHYLPTKYLIDPQGNIVGKFDDAELDQKLEEIFSVRK